MAGTTTIAVFFLQWTQTQIATMHELTHALDSDMKEAELAALVSRVIQHYEDYYHAKESACQRDILQIVTPPWKSPLEKAFMWIGGWRPSMAFQLVYALAGQQIEAELAELLDGVDTPSFASLSSSQLSQLSDLQVATVKEEESLGVDMAMLQQSLAEQPLLALAAAQGEFLAQAVSASSSIDNENIDSAINEKIRTLQTIAVRADCLRFTTLKKVLDLLQTFQKAQYLVAAAQMQVTLRQVGYKLSNEEPADADRAGSS